MKSPSRIKQYLPRARATVYRVRRSTISFVKGAWKACPKQGTLFVRSGEIWKVALKFLPVILVALAILLFIALFWHVFDWPGAKWIDSWWRTAAKEDTITILGILLTVVLAIIGVLFNPKKTRAPEETSKAQHDANEQQMLSDATEKLGDKSPSVRIGGIYALDTLARSNEPYLVRIVKILCAHLRETAKQKDYQENHKNEPSNEIQSLLEVLSELNRFSEEKKEGKQSKPVRLNLSGAYLVGANLENACLNRADLSGTKMRKANLLRAHLQKAILKKANMMDANLEEAQMQEAILTEADMRRAILIEAQMQSAILTKAWMLSAILKGAQMQDAILKEVQMQNAYLSGAQLQDANLKDAQLQGAVLEYAKMQGTFLFKTQMQGANLEDAQLQGAALWKTQMQGADLWMAQMQGAALWGTQMQGAYISRMQVQGVELSGVDLRGAYCRNPYVLGDLQKRIKERIDKPADVDTVIFSGGLKQEDVQDIRYQLTECQKNGWMTHEEVAKIIAILEKHQDKPASNKPPSNVDTDSSYDENEAEAIIDGYEYAMNIVELWG